MLFNFILTQKLIILGILSKVKLSIKEMNSLTYPMHLKINLLSLLYLLFENKEFPIICFKYNKTIHSTVFNYNKLVTELDIETTIPDS